jgi:excisionase family DNA binding protein
MNLITVKETAAHLKFHYDTIYQMISREDIPANAVIRLPSIKPRDYTRAHIRINKDALDEWIKREMLANLIYECEARPHAKRQ